MQFDTVPRTSQSPSMKFPPKTLSELMENLNETILKKFIDNEGVVQLMHGNRDERSAARKSHLLAANCPAICREINQNMKENHIQISFDDYSGADGKFSSNCVRLPFDRVITLQRPELGHSCNGTAPQISVFSVEQFHELRKAGWKPVTNSIYLPPNSIIPSTILDGTAWVTKRADDEGRKLIERNRGDLEELEPRDEQSSQNQSDAGPVTMNQPSKEDSWWFDFKTSKSRNLYLSDILLLWETGDTKFSWMAAQKWNITADKNYQNLAKCYVVICNKLLANPTAENDVFEITLLRNDTVKGRDGKVLKYMDCAKNLQYMNETFKRSISV